MLTFNEKLDIIESFPELVRKNVSLGRINFQYPESISDKKNIVYHLHPNGNGYVYAGELPGYQKDEKGMVNIRDMDAKALQHLLEKAINALSSERKKTVDQEERWINKELQELFLKYENDSWNIYFGLNLEESFDSYEEASLFLKQEGFHQE